jgi:hypothetical protein
VDHVVGGYMLVAVVATLDGRIGTHDAQQTNPRAEDQPRTYLSRSASNDRESEP